MKRSDYHMLLMFICLSPHLSAWVAVAIATLNVIMACIWVEKE